MCIKGSSLRAKRGDLIDKDSIRLLIVFSYVVRGGKRGKHKKGTAVFNI